MYIIRTTFSIDFKTMYKTIVKPIIHTYKKLSPFGKILIILVLFLIIMYSFRSLRPAKEGFTISATDFTFKSGNVQVYDNFYADIYDHLVFNNVKNVYEIKQIVDNTKPTEESIILDIGSGTGHHVAELASKKIKVQGVDISQDMVNKAKELYPDLNFVTGDVAIAGTFKPNSYTHILCMYFTIYYLKDKLQFFKNCFTWLMPGGYLVVHLVDRDMFDPILPPSNPLLLLTPQRYAKSRITTSKVAFNDFKYSSNFELDNSTSEAKFIEKFENKDNGKVFRKNEHLMYMEPVDNILSLAQEAGFIVQQKIDLIKSGYEYNMLYVLSKPE